MLVFEERGKLEHPEKNLSDENQQHHGQLIFQKFQVFDILPLYSTLHPHESQKIQFTFYGHANISSQAIARCSVHGGPDYDIGLVGQASLVQYFFDRQFVDYGKQVGLNLKLTRVDKPSAM